MPKVKSTISPTPFAQILTDYMARQRPIWTSGKLARTLQVRRQTVGNWLYHDDMPPLEKMLEVLAQLNIPFSEVLAAYRAAGALTPALDYSDLDTSHQGEQYERPATTSQAAQGIRERRIQTEAEHWREMMEHTRQTLSAGGITGPALDALLASIESSRSGKPQMERNVTSEMDEFDERDDQTEEQQERRRPGRPGQSYIPAGGAGSTRGKRGARKGREEEEETPQQQERNPHSRAGQRRLIE